MVNTLEKIIKDQEGRSSYKIYCDLDGVLANFITGIMSTLNISKEPTQDEIEEFLSTLEVNSINWWSNLDWQYNGKQLWEILKYLNTEILTACPSQCKMHQNVIKGKKLWCKKNLNLTSGINVTTRRGKTRFAAPNHILIDDYIKNCNEWKAAGGFAIHHIDSRRTVKELKDKLLELLG